MDLMTLAAKIVLDDSSYTKGVSNAEKMGEQLKNKMSAMTVAVGNIAADMIRKGFNGVQQIIGGAIDGYADYQQLIGGVETLFKSSADKVAKYAKQSFKTTGLSANDYMETVTSFSASLLQGLGGDTDKAAELANTAITDMADNANKMGTDISSIQAAYQGFAKQNYTMLDNLKLGYGGTQSEMVRLINDSKILDHQITDLDGITFDQMIAAIHKIQEEMGITGTTAREAADTISGSKASLKAAWEDLLSAVGGEGGQKRLDETLENFKMSFSTYMENFVPTLATTITNSGTLVETIAGAIASLPTTLLSELGEAGLEAGTDIVNGVSGITHWLIESIANMFKSASADPSQIKELGEAIGNFIGTAISDIVKNAPAILEGIVNVGVALAGGLVEGLFKGLFGEGAEVDKITKQLNEDLTDLDVQDAKQSALIKYIKGLADEFGQGVTEIDKFKQAKAELEEVMPGAGEIFEQYGTDIHKAVDELEKLQKMMHQAAVRAGLEKALMSEYELLGEQETTKARAEIRAETNQAEIDTMMERMTDSLTAYAQEYIRMNKGNEFVDETAMAEAMSIVNGGYVQVGDDQISLANMTPAQLESLLDQFGDRLKLDYDENETAIWDKEYDDNIYNPETLKAYETEIATLSTGITDAQKEAAEAQKQIEATQKEISITEAAVQRSVNDESQAFSQASGQVVEGGKLLGGALRWLSNMVETGNYSLEGYFSEDTSAHKKENYSDARDDANPGKHASGLWHVPYDNYRAILHRDEQVLSASQARQKGQQAGMDMNDIFSIVRDAIREGMTGVRVNSFLNGRDVTDDVSRNMARELKARRFRT